MHYTNRDNIELRVINIRSPYGNNVRCYTLERIICDIIKTVLKRTISNSRMKDYYDLYYFVNYKWKDLNIEVLKNSYFCRQIQ